MYRSSAVVITFGRTRVIDVVNIRTVRVYKTTTTSIYGIFWTTVGPDDNNSIRVLNVIFFSKRKLNSHLPLIHALHIWLSKSYHFNNVRNVIFVNISNTTRLPRPSNFVDKTYRTRLKNLSNLCEMFRFIYIIQTYTHYIHLYAYSKTFIQTFLFEIFF